MIESHLPTPANPEQTESGPSEPRPEPGDKERRARAGAGPRSRAYQLRSVAYFVGLALLSGTSLFLEISLTRLFATLFFPPYVFAVIALAILGVGLGAAAAAWRPGWRSRPRLPVYIALAGFATLAVLLVVVFTASIDLHGALLALTPLPYFFTGLALATIFSAAPLASPRLYSADLAGAALGALAAIPLLNAFGGINSMICAAVMLGLAALVMTDSSPRPTLSKILPLALLTLAIIGLGVNLSPALTWLTIDMANLASPKPITDSLAAGGKIIHTTWDSFARTDLVDPGQGKPYELYIDGAAASVMPPAGDLSLLRNDIGFFPFATTQPRQVLVVGPGGGLDVWFALRGGAQSITAVEVNPASVDIVNRYAAYHNNLYSQPEVRVLVDEGRSVLRREGRTYNLIYLSQVVTLAAERSGYALTENSVYTVEAFVDYLDHLRPNGQIALKLYDELTLSRAVMTAVAALVQARGISEAEAMQHLAIFLDANVEPAIPLLIVQDQPYTEDDAKTFAGVAAQVSYVPLFVPGVVASETLDRIWKGETTVAEIVAASPSNISPTTDNRPFFYQFERGLPQSLQFLLIGLGTLFLIGLIVLVIVQRKVVSPLARYAPLYFGALGVGFIVVEIALIQQTRLFLGHPTLAITTVLAALFIGGGLGSALAGRWSDITQSKHLIWVMAAIPLLILLWLFTWPLLDRAFLIFDTSVRVLVVAVTVWPLALLMGIPFPLGLRTVGQLQHGDRHVALGWAVNGIMTVIGLAGAMAMAMLSGFNSVLLIGVLAYAVAAIFMFISTRYSG